MVDAIPIENGVEEWVLKVSWHPSDYVMYSGRIERYKNIHRLANIVRILNTNFRMNFKLKVFGSGPFMDHLNRYLKRIGMECHVNPPQPFEEYVNNLSMSSLFGLLSARAMQLIDNEKIKLKEPHKPIPQSLKAYMRSGEAYWFWTTTLLAIATAIIVFAVPENAYPIVYIRYVLGSIFVLWFPGFTLIKALFPSKKEMDTIERAALSIGLSLAIVPIVGLLLNYTPWGIRLTPITLSLLALTITFATAALIREHQAKISENKNNMPINKGKS
jgi:hypothetical protein